MGRRRISSRELLAGSVEVEIEHEAQIYRLRQTALGKLILTK
jgi:hemin uptake protein HemP